MELTIEQALQQGIAAHKEGKLQDAEHLYRAILQSQPEHPDANHNLGVLAVSLNKADLALPLFKTALEANPKKEQFWLSYIDTLIKEQRFDNAKQVLARAKNQGVAGDKLKNLEAQLTPATQSENVNSADPSQQQLISLLELYQNGRFSDAEKLALSITTEFPRHQFAWKVLGAVLNQLGRICESVFAKEKAVTLSPKDAGAHNNLGATLQELRRLDEALASFNRAVALKPDYALAYNNLGATLQEQGRLDEALASFNRAIALKPDYALAYNNLGFTLKKLGRLDEALASFSQAIVLKPNYAEALLNLSSAHGYMDNLESEIVSLQKILQMGAANHGLRAGVNLAICKFLKGDFKDTKSHLLSAAKIRKEILPISKNEKVYHEYLSKIMEWHENKYLEGKKGKNDKILYVVGESHSLASHQLCIQNKGINFFCTAKLIKGCKQWHLGNAHRNQYKHQFEDIFAALPKYSYVLMAIGEIDCRLDNGIIIHNRKFPERQIKEIISNTVENYLNYIVNNNYDYQHNVIIQGVPCPNLSVKNHSEKEIRQLVEVIKIFNYELKTQSREKGFGFLDTHELTDDGDGMSNDSWHIDNYHLSPEGMKEAWRRYASEQ